MASTINWCIFRPLRGPVPDAHVAPDGEEYCKRHARYATTRLAKEIERRSTAELKQREEALELKRRMVDKLRLDNKRRQQMEEDEEQLEAELKEIQTRSTRTQRSSPASSQEKSPQRPSQPSVSVGNKQPPSQLSSSLRTKPPPTLSPSPAPQPVPVPQPVPAPQQLPSKPSPKPSSAPQSKPSSAPQSKQPVAQSKPPLASPKPSLAHSPQHVQIPKNPTESEPLFDVQMEDIHRSPRQSQVWNPTESEPSFDVHMEGVDDNESLPTEVHDLISFDDDVDNLVDRFFGLLKK